MNKKNQKIADINKAINSLLNYKNRLIDIYYDEYGFDLTNFASLHIALEHIDKSIALLKMERCLMKR